MPDENERLPISGFPGTWTVIRSKTSRYAKREDPRKYAARFLFGTPGLEPFRFAPDGESIELCTDMPGDSPLKMPDIPSNGMREIALKCPEKPSARAELRVNQHQRLSSITVFVESVGPEEAAHEAGEYALPQINWLCYVHDVGVSIVAIDVLDEEETHRWIYHYRHYDVAIQEFKSIKTEFPTQLLPLLALWRESLSTTNPYYQVILLRRILEGVDLGNATFGKYNPGNLSDERFPDHENILAAYRGKKVGPFLDEIKKLRSFFAHFALDDEDVIHVPDMVSGRRNIEVAIPSLRFAIKVKLDNLRLRMLECLRGDGEPYSHCSPIPMKLDDLD